MNQEVPQPATATRSPRAGSWPATWLASRAARRQQPGCDATSASVRPAPAAITSCSPTPSPLRSSRPMLLSKHCGPRSRSAAGQPGGGHRADEVPLRQEEDHQHRQQAHHIARHQLRDLGPVRPWNVARPSGTVIWLVEVTAISGHRKVFHESRKVSVASVASGGADSGSTILRSTVSRLAPSTRADSPYSIGSVRKTWRGKKIPNAEAALGRISAPRWLIPTPAGRQPHPGHPDLHTAAQLCANQDMLPAI